MMFTHGQSDVVADIFDAQHNHAYHENLDDTYEVKCGALFQLTLDQTTGWLGVHINAGRGITGLLRKALQSDFQPAYPELVLEINPCVSRNALLTAAQQNLIEKVKLVKLVQPNDAARALTNKWVRGNTIGRLELDVTGLVTADVDEPQGRRGRRLREKLIPDLIVRYFGGDRDAAFREIVEFVGGLQFDQAKFEVAVPGGGTRTYNIERPDTGYAITEDLDLALRAGEPTQAGLRQALAHAIAHAQEQR
jgi:hypothetical protein